MEKLTLEKIKSLVVKTEFQRFGETTTVCAAHLASGFVVIGVSGCLNPADFDEQKGREIAEQDAINQLWKLQGYHVKVQYAESEQANDPN